MKRKVTKYILLIILFLLGILLYKFYLNNEDRLLAEKGFMTVGKVIKVGFPGRVSVSGYSYRYFYYVENVKYHGGSLSNEKFPEGSFFEVVYLPENPEKSEMDFSRTISPKEVCSYFEGDCPFKKE